MIESLVEGYIAAQIAAKIDRRIAPVIEDGIEKIVAWLADTGKACGIQEVIAWLILLMVDSRIESVIECLLERNVVRRIEPRGRLPIGPGAAQGYRFCGAETPRRWSGIAACRIR